LFLSMIVTSLPLPCLSSAWEIPDKPAPRTHTFLDSIALL
jgi:hypothetical protein